MVRWLFAAFVLLALLLVVGLHPLPLIPQVDADTSAVPSGPAFATPVFIEAKDGVAFTLENAEIRQLGGRAFVVGREAKDSPHEITMTMFDGGMVWVPVDSVTRVVELVPHKSDLKRVSE